MRLLGALGRNLYESVSRIFHPRGFDKKRPRHIQSELFTYAIISLAWVVTGPHLNARDALDRRQLPALPLLVPLRRGVGYSLNKTVLLLKIHTHALHYA